MVIVANVSHTLINCTCKNRLSFSLLPFTLIPKVQLINTVKSTRLWLVLVGFHDFQIFPDRTSRALSGELGKHMFGLSLFRPSRQSNPSPRRAHVGPTSGPRRAKRDSNIPSPGRTRLYWSNALPQGQQR